MAHPGKSPRRSPVLRVVARSSRLGVRNIACPFADVVDRRIAGSALLLISKQTVFNLTPPPSLAADLAQEEMDVLSDAGGKVPPDAVRPSLEELQACFLGSAANSAAAGDDALESAVPPGQPRRLAGTQPTG